jgi:hypothetical protein
MEINVEKLFTELVVHTTRGQLDKVIPAQCAATVLIYLLNQKSAIKVVLDPSETELYQQLVTKIENRVRERIKDEAVR